jgi:hypothetical protein
MAKARKFLDGLSDYWLLQGVISVRCIAAEMHGRFPSLYELFCKLRCDAICRTRPTEIANQE